MHCTILGHLLSLSVCLRQEATLELAKYDKSVDAMLSYPKDK